MGFILPYIWFFILGTALGSFFNVLADRLPEGRDVVFERSVCSECGTVLKWYDLIPVVSFITLGGKCRYCKTRLSPWYFVSEIIVGLLYTFSFYLYSETADLPALFGHLVLWSLLYIVAEMDYKSGYIMDIFPIIIAVSGLIFGLLSHRKITDILLAGAVGAAVFGLIYILCRLILKREGLGLGDVFLIGGAGLWLSSWKEVIITCFLSAYVALVFIIIKALKKDKIGLKTEMPLGPSICIAVFIMNVWGGEVLAFISKIILG